MGDRLGRPQGAVGFLARTSAGNLKSASASAGWGRADTRRHSGYVYCNEETPLTFESHAFPEDMVNAFRYPLPSSHKQRARKLRERDHGSPHLGALILGTRATKHTRQHT